MVTPRGMALGVGVVVVGLTAAGCQPAAAPHPPQDDLEQPALPQPALPQPALPQSALPQPALPQPALPQWASACGTYSADLRDACLVRLLADEGLTEPQLAERCPQLVELGSVHDECLGRLSWHQAAGDIDAALASCAAIDDRVWREECRLQAVDRQALAVAPDIAVRNCSRHVRHFTSHCISHAQEAWADRQSGARAWFSQDALLEQLAAVRDATPMTQRFLLAPWFGGLLAALDPAAQAQHCASLFYEPAVRSCAAQTSAVPLAPHGEHDPWW